MEIPNVVSLSTAALMAFRTFLVTQPQATVPSELCLRSASFDEDDISVLDNIVLAFRHYLSFRPDLIFVPKLFQYVVVEDYALDECLLEICQAG